MLKTIAPVVAAMLSGNTSKSSGTVRRSLFADLPLLLEVVVRPLIPALVQLPDQRASRTIVGY
jgi:hypothetical protein